MIHTIAAQVALVAFAAAIFAGLFAGNSPATVLTRALAALVVALFVGHAVAWTIKLVLRDHLRKRKSAIDREHLQALESAEPEASQVAASTTETG